MEMLLARQSCFVPFEMMPPLLGQDLSPRQAFTLVYPWLESQGLLEACKLLAGFVRASNTKLSMLTGNEMPGTGLLAQGTLFKPEVDLELYSERTVLHRDLTGLKTLGANPARNHIVATLASAVEALKESHLQDTREVARVQPIRIMREVFGESNTRCLLALCQVGDAKNLPAVHQAWAGKQKTNHIQHILQDHVDSCA